MSEYTETYDRESRERFKFLIDLVNEAIPFLLESFGREATDLMLSFPNERGMLKAVVKLPAGYQGAEAALKKFDEIWWLKNCDRSSGDLVFDYSISEAA